MGREFTAANGYTTRDLLVYARDHMASAGVLFRTSFDCYDSAGYLSHLGIELLLKATLLHHAGRFPADHDLLSLLRQAQEHDPHFNITDSHLSTLTLVNRFNRTRYPVPTEPINIGDEDWDELLALWNTLVFLLPSMLRDQLQSKTARTPEGEAVVKGNRVLMRRPKDRGIPDADR